MSHLTFKQGFERSQLQGSESVEHHSAEGLFDHGRLEKCKTAVIRDFQVQVKAFNPCFWGQRTCLLLALRKIDVDMKDELDTFLHRNNIVLKAEIPFLSCSTKF